MCAARTEPGLPLFDWSPPVKVLPFPPRRRVDYIRKQAGLMAGMHPEKADAHLGRQLDLQRETLARKGVEAARIDVELVGLKDAITARYLAELSCRGVAS